MATVHSPNAFELHCDCGWMYSSEHEMSQAVAERLAKDHVFSNHRDAEWSRYIGSNENFVMKSLPKGFQYHSLDTPDDREPGDLVICVSAEDLPKVQDTIASLTKMTNRMVSVFVTDV